MLISRPSAFQDAPRDNGPTVIEVADITKTFGGVRALRGVSFSVRAGEVHALLGENGAGKSTLMGVAVGEVTPDAGTIALYGNPIERLDPQSARSQGIAIVHQSPTLIPALTILENFRLLGRVPSQGGERFGRWVARQLQAAGCVLPPTTRIADVGISHRQQIELAKALALAPKILILDEPTAALTADMVRLLFDTVRALARQGTAVIYISHRLEEIRQICDRVTVMRDGCVQAVSPIGDLSDEDIVTLIVGRKSESIYPNKNAVSRSGGLSVRTLSGRAFEDVAIDVSPGEIVGLAGITGNGQDEFLRALAGLTGCTGTVVLDGQPLRIEGPSAAHRAGIAFMSADRPNEGLILRMSVRENAAVGGLSRFARFGLLRRGLERGAVERHRRSLSIKTPSIDATVSTLSGGNQQKVVLARALLAEPRLLLAEEPTAGVDIGSRSEIYHILRQAAEDSTPVLVLSSDLAELEGLCDRVYVFSRGRVVARLAGPDVTQENIGREMIKAPTSFRASKAEPQTRVAAPGMARRRASAWRLADSVPALVLAVTLFALALGVSGVNPRYLSIFNVDHMLLLAAALSLIGFGQLCVVLTGGLDLSVGPLVGLTVVVASFYFGSATDPSSMAIGCLLILCTGLLTGLANGTLIAFLGFTPVAATIGSYIILQGISVILRPYPDGPIDSTLIDLVQSNLFGVPAVFLLGLILVCGLEWALRASAWGIALRATGSDRVSAVKVGVRTGALTVLAYVLSSLFAVAGGFLVAMQLGIGDPNQGLDYTLSSVAAVVLGGASLFGGRGSFVTVMLGAVLLVMVNGAMPFLGLGGAWQYWFMGGLILLSVSAYSRLASRN